MTFDERSIKATRKPAQCVGCWHKIEVGSPAIRWTGLVEGDFNAVVYHPECRAAEIALNKEHGTFGDEWMNLGDAISEEPDNWIWLQTCHPVAATRFAPEKDQQP